VALKLVYKKKTTHKRGKKKAPRPVAKKIPDGARAVAWYALREGRYPSIGGAQEQLVRLAKVAELDSRDQGLAFEMMQGVWRNRIVLDTIIDNLEGFVGRVNRADIRNVLRLGVYQHFYMDRIPVHALVHATVEVARAKLGGRIAGFCNAALQRLLLQHPGGNAELPGILASLPLEKRYSFPAWVVEKLAKALDSEDLEQVLATMNTPLPLYGRANTDVATVEKVVEGLKEAGIESVPRPDLAPLCIELMSSAGPISEAEIFVKGGLFIQDASSQLVAELAASTFRPKEGGKASGLTVVDFCAAPGGKSTYLAACLGADSKLLACDMSPSRLVRLRENVARLGLKERIMVVFLAESAMRNSPTDPMGEQVRRGSRGATDRDAIPVDVTALPAANMVLIDAPCTGFGTVRRHPEIRWRVKEADMLRLAKTQKEILDRAVSIVKPGGHIVYSTCSLTREENEEVISAFLKGRPGEFEIVTDRSNLPEVLAEHVEADGWLRLYPTRDRMDSARAVRLRRKA